MVSKNFKRKEFACKCGCGTDNISQELVDVVQDVRTWAKSPVVINSGLRCESHNRSVGGAPKSQHLYGTAADIRTVSKTPKEVYDYLNEKYPNKYGIGLYGGFTHIDVRPNRARW